MKKIFCVDKIISALVSDVGDVIFIGNGKATTELLVSLIKDNVINKIAYLDMCVEDLDVGSKQSKDEPYMFNICANGEAFIESARMNGKMKHYEECYVIVDEKYKEEAVEANWIDDNRKCEYLILFGDNSSGKSFRIETL